MSEPAPSGPDASWGMIEPKVVRVTDTCHFASQCPLSLQHVGCQIGGSRDPT